jgi:hypothetical protein
VRPVSALLINASCLLRISFPPRATWNDVQQVCMAPCCLSTRTSLAALPKVQTFSLHSANTLLSNILPSHTGCTRSALLHCHVSIATPEQLRDSESVWRGLQGIWSVTMVSCQPQTCRICAAVDHRLSMQARRDRVWSVAKNTVVQINMVAAPMFGMGHRCERAVSDGFMLTSMPVQRLGAWTEPTRGDL